jgi:hypothetical protein
MQAVTISISEIREMLYYSDKYAVIGADEYDNADARLKAFGGEAKLPEKQPAKHLAILSAPGLMIHAHDGASVCEAPFGPWWQRHLAAAFRFPEITP